MKSKLTKAAELDKSGLDFDYWGVVVDREGVVCAVAFSGAKTDSQWLLSRQIAAAKAFTANGLSLDKFAISSGALYGFVQSAAPKNGTFPGFAPGNPLFGLSAGNPLAPAAAFAGDYADFGTADDPMVGKRVGGTITFGGGLALYKGGKVVGGLGLSGDTACADHSTAWRTRNLLGMNPPSASAGLDKISLTDDGSGHPHCPNDEATQGVN